MNARSSAAAADPRGPAGTSRAVVVGGGHGAARSLAALPSVVDHVSAVVTVADDGGSSGRLRRDLAVLPPGDLRMALTALARDRELAEIVSYRFERGELAGHSLGNLLLVALEDLSSGDVLRALDRLGALLGVPGRVLPCTLEHVTLTARIDGGAIRGQAAVATTPRIQRVRLEPSDPPATPDAVEAIAEADLIVLGPGSLYTSLLPNLLVPGIGDAVAGSRGPVVLVANLREQPGETEGMSLADHLDVLVDHVPRVRLDVVLAHEGPAPSGPGRPLAPDASAVAAHGARLVTTNLLDGHDGHDPAALAEVFTRLLHD